MLNAKKIESVSVDSRPASDALVVSGRPTRTLIVEDNGFDRRRITHAAREAGLNLDFAEAANATEARRMMDTEAFDLCIFDYILPDGDGVALARARDGGKCAGTPVIIVAGQGEAAVAVEAMHSGCSDYLLKDSLSPESLKRSVINALDKSRLRDERNSAQLEGEILRSVLERFSRDCVTELRPTVTRMLRLIRGINTEIRDPRAAEKLRELESAGTLLFGFLQEIERYAGELPESYLTQSETRDSAISRAETQTG